MSRTALADSMLPLSGRRGLVLGVANAHSIAWGCAEALHAQGAALVLSWLNEKARPWVQPLADTLGAPLIDCNVVAICPATGPSASRSSP